MGHVITMVTLCDACFPKKLTVLWLLICIGYPIDATYHYLGCYKDVPTNRDLYKSEITFPVGGMNVADCVKECLVEGQPYAGLQEGRKCYCGPTYGKHGVATNIACNYTCNGDTEWCGGKTANSVYYTIQIDATSKAARTLKKYETPTSYEAARQSCVLKNGDLALAKTTQTVDEIVALFANVELNGSQRKVWVGLSKLNNNSLTSQFRWVDPTLSYNDAEMAVFWASGQPAAFDCVVISIDTKKWETSSCLPTYPFVCLDSGTVSTSIDYPTDTGGSSASTTQTSSSSTLALAIVLPLFILCYGGSCLIYCVHKMYRNFKRKEKRRLLLEKEDDFTEFEPDTKPSTPSADSLKRRDVNPMPSGVLLSKQAPPYMKHDPWKAKRDSIRSEEPADESEPEPSRPSSVDFGSRWSGLTSRGSVQSIVSVGPIVSSRPTTSEGVHINMDESLENSPPGTADPNGAPPPGYYQASNFEKTAKKIRAEKRRNRLLENALKEARERRAKERSSLSSASISVRPKRGSSRMSHDEEDPTVSLASLRLNSGKSVVSVKPKKKNDFQEYQQRKSTSSLISSGSGSSTSSLMNEDQKSPSADAYDPTKMSIADIIKIKQMMRDKKKRARKIIIT